MKTVDSASNSHSLASIGSFYARAKYFQLRRLVRDKWRGLPTLGIGERDRFPYLLAESVTPLFTNADSRELPLLVGKNKNLRLACDSINGRVLDPGQTFSFWKQVGPPRKSRGFVMGREVREGCVIPTIGGGLCQLSGSLLEVASLAGLEVVERHSHTALPADIRHHPGRDATVFWNYVDLRFKGRFAVRLECSLTEEHLAVRMYGKVSSDRSTGLQMAHSVEAGKQPRSLHESCFTCGETSCARHPK
jgi:vancomycin resistance protein YoaR